MPWLPVAFQAQQPVRVVLVGDSTVTDDSGWGLGFKESAREGVDVRNTAANGRSSKSFIDEGRWKVALAERGQYYLIQFGHNDEPGKGPERETDPATTYTANMRRYVSDVRAIGATPVLVTSLARRLFDPANPGKIRSSQIPYVEAVRRLAAEERVALIDLFATSVELSERLGPAALEALSPRQADGAVDRTHLNAAGSRRFAQLVVTDLRRVVPALAPILSRRAAGGWSRRAPAQRRCDRRRGRHRTVRDGAGGDQRRAAEHQCDQPLDHPRQARHVSRGRLRPAREALRDADRRRPGTNDDHLPPQGV